MASRRCAIKTIRVLAAATLKCPEPGKANTGGLVQVRFTSHGPSNRKDGNEARNHCRCGGRHEQENCARRFIGCQGVYKFESQKTTTLGAQTSSRSLHSTASREERTMQQVRDSRRVYGSSSHHMSSRSRDLSQQIRNHPIAIIC